MCKAAIKPECSHPGIEILGTQTLNMERRGIWVDMDILTTLGGWNGSIVNVNLITDRLAWLEGIGEQARLVEGKITTGKACAETDEISFLRTYTKGMHLAFFSAFFWGPSLHIWQKGLPCGLLRWIKRRLRDRERGKRVPESWWKAWGERRTHIFPVMEMQEWRLYRVWNRLSIGPVSGA